MNFVQRNSSGAVARRSVSLWHHKCLNIQVNKFSLGAYVCVCVCMWCVCVCVCVYYIVFTFIRNKPRLSVTVHSDVTGLLVSVATTR